MSEKNNVVNTSATQAVAVEEKATEQQISAAERADAVAQQKLAGLAYAENYRQKLREEKAQRMSSVRRKAEQEKLEIKERERRERRERLEQMLRDEKAAVAERNAKSDAVLTVVAEAEKAKDEAEAPAQPDRAAEIAAAEQAMRIAEEKAAEQARAAEETAAEAARAADEQSRAEEQAAEEAARKEATAQVQQIVARVEAERAAEQARENEERAAAQKAAAEARLAEEQAAAEKAAEETRAAEEQAAVERAAFEAKKNERRTKQESVRAEAAEMAAQHLQAARDEADRRRQDDGAAEQTAEEAVAVRPAARSSDEDTDLLEERRRARQLALERVRSANMADRVGSLAAEENAYMPYGEAETDGEDGAYVPYDNLSAVPYTDEDDARSAMDAVREARIAERDAKRAMRGADGWGNERDFDAERRSVAPAVIRDLPAEPSYEGVQTEAETVVLEEKQYRRESRRADKLVRGAIRGKKVHKKNKKKIEQLVAKETKHKEKTEGAVAKEVRKAERVLTAAEKKELRAARRVARAQRIVDRLTEKQAAMEAKHVRRLAKRPSLAAKLNAREELLAKDILRAHRQVDKVAVKEEKQAQRVLAAQQKLDRVLGKQSAVERKNDRRMDRIRRAEAQVESVADKYERKTCRRLSKNELAPERAAARENIVLNKGEISRSLLATSSRQLAYEKRRLKKGAVTLEEAERTVNKQTHKTREVIKAERRLALTERSYAALGRAVDKRQKRVDRLTERLSRMEEQHAKLLETDAILAPKLLNKERKLTRKLTRAQKKVAAAERRQDLFEKKNMVPVLAKLQRAQRKQNRIYEAQNGRMLRAKRTSDRAAYRVSRKCVERKNLEEKRRVTMQKSAIDAAELAALTAPRKHDTRKVRVLKRQAKLARKRERDAELRAMRSRRDAEKAAALNELKNYENERLLQKNPKAYKAIRQKAEKNRRRLAEMERVAERDERRLVVLTRRSDKATLKLEKALGNLTIDRAAVVAAYGKRTEQPYVQEDASLARMSRRAQRKEAARARKEEREYARLMTDMRRGADVPMTPADEVASDSIAAPTEAPASAAANRRTAYDVQGSLRTLDRLYEERMQLEEKSVLDAAHIPTAVRLVNLQKEICDEHFFLLRKKENPTDRATIDLAEQATEELRRYNRYVAELNRKTGRFYSFAKLTAAYGILEGKNPPRIAHVTYKETHAERASRMGVSTPAYAADVPRTPTEEPLPMMRKREFSAYVNGILKTNVGIEKEKKAIRKAQKKQRRHALIRSQAELLALQKAILDNYFLIFSAAREQGRSRQVRSLVKAATGKIREYNYEVKQLQALDNIRHARLDTAMAKKAWAGEPYGSVPTMVCALPDRKGEHTVCSGMGLSDTDRALVESRFNYRIAALERSLKDARYDYVLFPGGVRRSNRSKKQTLNKLKADKKLALTAEMRDNRRYEALMAYEPREKGYGARKVNNREVLALRRDVSRLLQQRDDINRELLSLYTMTDDGVSMRVHEQYDDGRVVYGKGGSRKVATPPVVHEQGYLTRRGRQIQSVDYEFARIYDREKSRQYKKGMKRIAEVNRLRLPRTNKDVQALYTLHNRRVDLVTTVETTNAKIRTYGYKGKAAAAVRKERADALKALKRVDSEIKGRMARARVSSQRRPKPFWC